MERALEATLRDRTGFSLEDFDLLYTFPTGHDLFSDLVALHASPRAVFAVFGLGSVLPRYDGLRPLRGDNPVGGCLGLYRRE